MSRIDVVPEGKKFKVLVNFVKEGITFTTAELANKNAKEMHDNKYPHAMLNLLG